MMTLRLHGIDKLEKQLKRIEEAVRKGGLKRAVRKAFKPVLAAARAKAPVDTGLLRKRIKMRVASFKEGQTVTTDASGAVAGLYVSSKPASVAGGAGKPEARNWAWYEHGIPSRGIAAHPIFRSALDENADKAVETLRREVKAEIEAALK